METTLTLITKCNPRKIKGIDAKVGAIVDSKNNLICLVPISHIDWVFESVSTKEKLEMLYEKLHRADESLVALCSGCRHRLSEPEEVELSPSSAASRFRVKLKRVKSAA
jgi:hypothetical protein